MLVRSKLYVVLRGQVTRDGDLALARSRSFGGLSQHAKQARVIIYITAR